MGKVWFVGAGPGAPDMITVRGARLLSEAGAILYTGSLVADCHRTLLSGGVFMYPADTKDPDKPYGKLRLCYECAPLAFIVEQAGGAATDGFNPVMRIRPNDLHQRVPFFFGNKDLVEAARTYIERHDAGWIAAYQAQIELE